MYHLIFTLASVFVLLDQSNTAMCNTIIEKTREKTKHKLKSLLGERYGTQTR